MDKTTEKKKPVKSDGISAGLFGFKKGFTYFCLYRLLFEDYLKKQRVMNTSQTAANALFLFSLFSLFSACTPPAENAEEAWNDWPVVGKVVTAGKDTLLSCDRALLTRTVSFPLSRLADSLEIIPLDNRNEALVNDARVTVSDHYLLVWGRDPIPFKLFDRQGRFLTDIGGFGQGPGEYQVIGDAQIDEANNRIYLQPWQRPNLLVFDLEGNLLPAVPLCLTPPKPSFRVYPADSTLVMAILPFPNWPALLWAQDLKGKRKQFVEPGHLTMPHDFSNEIRSSRNTDAFDLSILSIMPTRKDTLYHYLYAENRLAPRFTLNFTEDPLPWHSYTELPGYFAGSISYPVQESEFITVSSPAQYYLIDKKTLKGAFVRMENDYLGKYEIADWEYTFQDGYFCQNMEPAVLKTALEKALQENRTDEAAREQAKKWLEKLDENQNNYILIAPLKGRVREEERKLH